LIREAGTSDLDALVELNLHVQRLHVEEEPERFVEPSRDAVAAWLSERLAEEGWRALVAESDGRCAGYVLFELIDRPAGIFTAAMRALYIHQIGVDPGVRRRGIGRALLEAVEREAAELGVQQVALDTWSFNASAQAFFTGCGYEIFNVRLRRHLRSSRSADGSVS
jgi:ribosomal protein S18 acetylase RimI-like enzyme